MTRHQADGEFWKCYARLPKDIRKLADKSFDLMLSDPQHPSLRFKKLKSQADLWSARVGLFHRAIAIKVDGGFLWIWIGTHAEYDKQIGKKK
jgi:mRNA-degrading endonuclease RelE of RelBE toxin-antitoxin system